MKKTTKQLQLAALNKMYNKFVKLDYIITDIDLLVKINKYMDYKELPHLRLEQLRRYMSYKHVVYTIDQISYCPNLELAHLDKRK